MLHSIQQLQRPPPEQQGMPRGKCQAALIPHPRPLLITRIDIRRSEKYLQRVQCDDGPGGAVAADVEPERE